MEKYNEYKDSGVQWLGEIPRHWEVVPLKRIFKIHAGATPSTSRYDYWDGNICWITPADYNTSDHYIGIGDRNLSQKGYESCGTHLVPKGSLVFSKRAPIGLVAITINELCTNQGCLACVPCDVSPDFYYYAFQTYKNTFEMFGSGTTFKEISASSFSNFKISVPTLPEQQAIATYLDKTTAKIDEAIAQQQKMIDLLNERKQIIINNAVTKGLNPDAPMKDSGVEWIGEIPEHWKVVRNKYIFRESDERNHNLNYILLSFSKSKGIVPQSEINDRGSMAEDLSNYKVFHKGQLLENRLQAWNGMFGTGEIEGCVSSDYTVFNIVKSGVSVDYVAYLFKTPKYIEQWANASKGIGTGFNRLYTPQFNNVWCVLPPYSEQISIIEDLKKATETIDASIREQNAMISLLQERKQIIINDVVTGKVKVS